MNDKPVIAIIGCGNLGSAMLRGWLADDALCGFSCLVVHRHDLAPDLAAHDAVTHIEPTDTRLQNVDLVMVAVKPQTMQDCADEITPLLHDNTPILSVATGLTLDTLERYFGDRPLIRTMPNTPSAVGKGMTVAMCNVLADQTLSDQLLSSLGLVAWIDDESLFDSMSALSGAGPAYVFYMIEVLTQAGIHAGVPQDLAELLAKQTVIGGAALAEHSDESAAQLRSNVTSKAGITHAALQIIMDGRVQDVFNDALIAARNRSAEFNQ